VCGELLILAELAIRHTQAVLGEMPILNATGPKADRESRVLTAFLQTRSREVRAGKWEYSGGNAPIDFIWRDRGIGVELCEWLDPEQAQWVAERDRFREEIESEIERRKLVQFLPGGRSSRCTVEVLVSKLPGRSDKQKVIDELIQFMVEFEGSHKDEIYRGSVIAHVSQGLLPSSLSAFLAGLIFYGFPGQNLGVPVRKAYVFDGGQAVESDSAARSLEQAVRAKIVTKAGTYEAEKRRLSLSGLWLVVHYSSPGVFNAPFVELKMQVGYGAHRRASQDKVAMLAATIVRKIGGGAFDSVFFMIDCQPETYVSQLWPKPGGDQ